MERLKRSRDGIGLDKESNGEPRRESESGKLAWGKKALEPLSNLSLSLFDIPQARPS